MPPRPSSVSTSYWPARSRRSPVRSESSGVGTTAIVAAVGSETCAPQFAQKRAPSATSVPQRKHVIVVVLIGGCSSALLPGNPPVYVPVAEMVTLLPPALARTRLLPAAAPSVRDTS